MKDLDWMFQLVRLNNFHANIVSPFCLVHDDATWCVVTNGSAMIAVETMPTKSFKSNCRDIEFRDSFHSSVRKFLWPEKLSDTVLFFDWKKLKRWLGTASWIRSEQVCDECGCDTKKAAKCLWCGRTGRNLVIGQRRGWLGKYPIDQNLVARYVEQVPNVERVSFEAKKITDSIRVVGDADPDRWILVFMCMTNKQPCKVEPKIKLTDLKYKRSK